LKSSSLLPVSSPSDAAGFTGSDCEKATAFLEQALGQIQHREAKPERYRKLRRQQQVGR